MQEITTIQGLVATTPRHIKTDDGIDISSFRLVSTQRRFNREISQWEDANANWYSVVAFRRLAGNVAECINKGDRVVITGRLKVKDWDNGEKTGTSIEIEAEAIGHDLNWGTTSFTRTVLKADSQSDAEETEPALV